MLGIIAGSFYGADYTARPKPGFFMPEIAFINGPTKLKLAQDSANLTEPCLYVTRISARNNLRGHFFACAFSTNVSLAGLLLAL